MGSRFHLADLRRIAGVSRGRNGRGHDTAAVRRSDRTAGQLSTCVLRLEFSAGKDSQPLRPLLQHVRADRRGLCDVGNCDPKALTGRVIVYSQLYLHGYWIGGAILGATAGQWIPDSIVGLDFALTALFVVLSIEAIRAQNGFAVPVAAVTCALVARLAAPDHMLPIAMGAFVLFLIGRFVYDSRKAKIDA